MKYLVPFDFTDITLTALHHALSLADVTGAGIELLHIVSSEKEVEEAKQKLEKTINELDIEDGSRVTSKVRVGDIFTDISAEADSEAVQLLVMGTHGAKGLQKLFGSKAIKVINSSTTPFIITQAKGPTGKLKKIVMPVDLSKESVQIVKFAADLAKRFDSEVHLVHQTEKDEWLQKKVKGNTGLARLELTKHKIPFEVSALPGKESMHKEVMKYGADIGADLFAIAHFSESILPQFDKFSQEMITNDIQIPTLIISAQAISLIESQYTFMTI